MNPEDQQLHQPEEQIIDPILPDDQFQQSTPIDDPAPNMADDQIAQLLQTQHTELIQVMTDNHNAMIQAQNDSITYLVAFMAGLAFAALLTYLLDRGVVK